MSDDWIIMHKKIKEAVEKHEDCVNIRNIAEILDNDVENVRKHFEVMKMDGYGNFMDEEKEIFCTMANPVEVFSYITKDDIEKQRHIID